MFFVDKTNPWNPVILTSMHLKSGCMGLNKMLVLQENHEVMISGVEVLMNRWVSNIRSLH